MGVGDFRMKDLLARAFEYQENYGIVGRAHYLAADHNSALYRYFGIPVIVITAVVGTTIFGTLNENPDPIWRIITGLILLAGTILSSLQTSLGFAQIAEKHKAAGQVYRAVWRRFGMFCLKYAQGTPDQRQAAFDELQKIVESLDEMPREFPTVLDRFYEKAKKEQREENRRLSAQQGASADRPNATAASN